MRRTTVLSALLSVSLVASALLSAPGAVAAPPPSPPKPDLVITDFGLTS